MTETTDLRWTGASKRAFLETFAGTGSVAQACAAAGKSRQAAYTLAQRAPEEAFRLGWAAAQMIARSAILDILMERVVDGVEIVTVRDASDPDRRVTSRRSYSHRIGLDLYSRLHRMIEEPLDWASSRSDAAIVARDFPGLLDLVEADAAFGEARAFVEDTSARLRAAKSRIQCQLAQEDYYGDLIDPGAADRDRERKVGEMSAWRHEERDWRTDFPPPPGFAGQECGEFGSSDYWRTLTPEEEAEMAAYVAEEDEKLRSAAEMARQDWFASTAIETKAHSGKPAFLFDRRRACFDERRQRSSALAAAPLEPPHRAALRGGAGGLRKGRMFNL